MSEYEKNIAYRESSQIVSTDEYFKARPQIDNHDRRKVFESGFERGWEASKKHYEASPTAESITIPLAEYEAIKAELACLKTPDSFGTKDEHYAPSLDELAEEFLDSYEVGEIITVDYKYCFDANGKPYLEAIDKAKENT
jgi:hypothetical protein